MREYKKTALVLGAGGFIGSHMVKRLRKEGYWVRGVDLKYPEFSKTEANEFICGDLRDVEIVRRVIRFGGYRELGSWIQVPGPWIADLGFCMLQSDFRILDPATRSVDPSNLGQPR